MKEAGINIKLTKGLRHHKKGSRNSSDLTECFNLAVRENGLEPYETITNPITSIITSYPFPQMFIGSVHSILATSNKIYTINANWSVTLKLDLSGVISTEKPWHFADYGDYVVLCQGEVVVIYDTVTTIFTNRPADIDMPLLSSVCDFKGQMIGVPSSVWHDTDTNSVIWGAIGSASFKVDRSNVAGYRPMPWDGVVYKVMKLGDNIMVYGSGGVAALRFSGVNSSLIPILDYGIASRDAVGGDENNHIFVDERGYIHHITADLTKSIPSHKEYFSTMIGKTITVVHDPLENDFYITDNVRAFVKTDQGVSETSQVMVSGDANTNAFIGFSRDLSDDEGRIATETLDFGIRGQKTIDIVEVGADSGEEIYVAADWRADKTAAFRRTSFKRTNKFGWTALQISGVEHRLVIKSDAFTGFNLDYINVRLKQDDKRSIRGTTGVNTNVT